jgi:4-hydroxybenzoate polyprenyltransferase
MACRRIISMVKKLKILKAFLNLIRLPNLLIIAITQYFIRWFILKPLLGVSGFEVQLGTVQFACLMLSTVFLAASGYIINDYFDRKIDLVNRPGKVIVGRMISNRYAMLSHIIFSFIGILLGAYVSYSIGHLNLAIIFLFAAAVLMFYSTTYKRQLLVGNILISILVGIVPLMVLLFEFPLLVQKYKLYILATGVNFDFLIFWVGSYAAFAFIINLLREVVKDMEDYEGDFIFGRQTIPIVWGMKISKIVVLSLVIITIIPIIFLLIKYLPDKISIIYILLCIIAPLTAIAVGVFRAESKKYYGIISNIIKFVMLTGLLYCPLVNYIISALKH